MSLLEIIGNQLTALNTAYADYLVGAQYIRQKTDAVRKVPLEATDADFAIRYSSLLVREVVKTYHLFLLAGEKNTKIKNEIDELKKEYRAIIERSVLPEPSNCERFVEIVHSAYGKMIPETELLTNSQML